MVQEQYTSLPREELLISIGNAKKSLSEDYHRCRKAATELSRVLKRYNSACERYARRASVSTESRLQGIKAAARTAYGELLAVKQNLIETYERLMMQYAMLEEMGGSKREMKALRRRIEQLTESHSENMQRSLGDIEEGLPTFLSEAVVSTDTTVTDGEGVMRGTAVESATSAVGAQAKVGGDVGVATVGIAPITIDISEIVERSVTKAIERLSARLAKRIDEFVDSLSFPSVVDMTAAAELKTEIKNEIKCELNSEAASNAPAAEDFASDADNTATEVSCGSDSGADNGISESAEPTDNIETEVITEEVGAVCAHVCTAEELSACEECIVNADATVQSICEEDAPVAACDCETQPCEETNCD